MPGVDPSAWMDLDDQVLEEAVDRLFDGPTSGPTSDSGGKLVADLSGDPADGVDSLLAFGAACRSALQLDEAGSVSESESERLRERRVVARVLARTTRGDRETGVIDFVSEKLRRSSFLRVAAAILVVQVTVVPLIAWHLAKQPTREGFMTGIEPAPEVLEQDLPRLREPIEEAPTRHDDLMVIGTSLSAAIVGANVEGMNLDTVVASGALDHALVRLAQVAADPQRGMEAFTSEAAGADDTPQVQQSRNLLIRALDLESRLMAFENARHAGGLSSSIRELAEDLEGAIQRIAESGTEWTPAMVLAAKALERAAGLNLAVPEGPSGALDDGRDWFAWLADALEFDGAGSSSATVDAWLTAIRSR